MHLLQARFVRCRDYVVSVSSEPIKQLISCPGLTQYAAFSLGLSKNSIRASGQCSLQIIGSISTNSPSSTSPRTHFWCGIQVAVKKVYNLEPKLFFSSLRARPMPVVFNVLFMVLIVFFLEFGLPNVLPFCLGTYNLYCICSPYMLTLIL
jgi:hypothetical protein